MAATSENLVRKQILVSTDQIEKLTSLAASEGKSQAEIVRLAIDAFDPADIHSVSESELMQLVSERLRDAISATQRASKSVSKTLKQLSVVE